MDVKKKLMKFVTKVARKFRRGDNEKGFIGAGAGAVLIALGSTGYLGNTINSMVTSLAGTGASSGASGGTTATSSGGAASGIAGFVNDVVVLIGIISVILGIVEYRRLRKQIFKK
jgi:hypothetical protein